MSAHPEVSVLVCTRNRAAYLARTLSSLTAALDASRLSAEIVIVDNGSTDSTPELLSQWTVREPRLRVVQEERPGQTMARNTAVAASQGAVLLLTDDDVLVPREWLDLLATPLLDGSADAVAGGIVLHPSLERPWMTDYLRGVLAVSPSPGVGAQPLIGANMGMTRRVAETITWDPNLGPGALGMADDVLFYYQVQAAGFRIAAKVAPPAVHRLDLARLDRSSFLALAAKNGRSHAYIWRHWLHTDLRFLRARQGRRRVQLIFLRVSASRKNTGAITDREMTLVYDVTFLGALIKERGRPPRYNRQGQRLHF